MALRQIFVIGGIRKIGSTSPSSCFNPSFNQIFRRSPNLSFVTRNQLTPVSVRFLRNRGQHELRQNLKRSNSSSPSPFEGFVQPNHIRGDVLGRTFLFTAAFTVGSFVSVTIWEYEKIRSKALTALRNSNPVMWYKKRQKRNEDNPTEQQVEIARLKKELETTWNKLSAGEKIFIPILVTNVIVFALWRVPRLKPLMLKYFCSNPAAKAVCWPMFLSTFSHYSSLHLMANMYVLHSFSAAANVLGPEQFLGLYLSAGVISSFASYMLKIARANPGYSLGASGAIMAILAYVCAQYPDTKLSILFIPQLQFSASSGIQAIMCFDLAGIIFRWKLFDHAAHLGGAAVGLFWSYYGQAHLWPLREHFVGLWHQVRGKPHK